MRRFFVRISLLWAFVNLANAAVTMWLLVSQPLATYVLAKSAGSLAATGTATVVSMLWFRRSMRGTVSGCDSLRDRARRDSYVDVLAVPDERRRPTAGAPGRRRPSRCGARWCWSTASRPGRTSRASVAVADRLAALGFDVIIGYDGRGHGGSVALHAR